ncbi:MAG: glycine cleavage system aminomethyltransferase GcvT [Nitrospinae bacterium]|nr:glycine cleavage system aminomethyltransferase GcvT [Nitrospinota bacterium]
MKRTPLWQAHHALGARMVEFNGWEMPVQYTSIMDEHKATREKAGIFDVSHMGEIEVKGERAMELLSYLTPNDVAGLKENVVQYSALLNQAGGIIDDLLIYKVSDTRFFICVNAGNARKDFDWMSGHAAGFPGVEVVNLSRDFGMISLQGPNAEAILSYLTPHPIGSMGYYHFVTTTIGESSVLLSRTGYTGEDGFELFVNWNETAAIWDKIVTRGKSFGLRPVGLGARDTLRLEMRYPLHGHDINETTTPLEAGLGWIVKMDKGDFIGRQALAVQKETGLKRKLVGIELLDKGIPREGYEIVKNGEKVGKVTSGTLSPTLNKGIALCYVPAEYAAVGTSLQVDIRGKLYEAQIVKTPFVQSRVKKTVVAVEEVKAE